MRKRFGYLVLIAIFLFTVLLPNLRWPHADLGKVRADVSTPFLKRIEPDTITAGAPSFTLRVLGSGFVDGAQIFLDGVPLALPRVVKKDRIALAEVPALAVANVGTHTVFLKNADGGMTATQTLTVVQADPNLDIRLSGNSAEEALGQDLLLDIFEINNQFDMNAVGVVWGTDSPMTTFVNSGDITVVLGSDLLNFAANVPIMVREKGNRLSNVQIFFVLPVQVKLTSIDQDSIDVGSPDTTLTLLGNNFTSSAIVTVNSQPVATTLVKDGKLSAVIPASFFATVGELSVRVVQTGQQSHPMTIIVPPTADPFIFTVAPSLLRVGEPKAILEIDGANFTAKTQVNVDGVAAAIKDRGKRFVSFVVPPDFQTQVGSHTIQVVQTDTNVTSNPFNFGVVPDTTVSTVVGLGVDGFNPTCVQPIRGLLRGPRRLAVPGDGLIYIADQQNSAIRTFNLATQDLCTIIGTGSNGYNDSDTMLFPPTLSNPNGILIAPDGTIFIAENGNSVVRRARRAANGSFTVDTFAGNSFLITSPERIQALKSTKESLQGFLDGPANIAQFRQPDDMVIAPDGTIYVSDPVNEAIRAIRNTPSGLVVSTIAGNGLPGYLDGIGSLARFNTPTGLVLSADAKFLYVADLDNNVIRQINLATHVVDTLAGTGDVGGFDGPVAEATFSSPIGLALEPLTGTIFVSELGASDIRRISANGNVTTVAGGTKTKLADGPGVDAAFNQPKGIALDAVNHILYVCDYQNQVIRKIVLQ